MYINIFKVQEMSRLNMLGRLVALLIEIFLDFFLYMGQVAYPRWNDEYGKII